MDGVAGPDLDDGSAAWTTHPGPRGPQGEITLLAVDPAHQQRGIARALIESACATMRVSRLL